MPEGGESVKDCEYCNYYRSINEDAAMEASRKIICTFTGTVMHRDLIRPDMEYPCSNVAYQEYEGRRKLPEKTPREKIPNLKFMYKSVHPVAERDRIRAVI
jgi:hypothetical protein